MEPGKSRKKVKYVRKASAASSSEPRRGELLGIVEKTSEISKPNPERREASERP